MSVTRASRERRFTGLEVPPIVTSGLPGREFVLHAEDIGSLNIGSTVFYRHIPAGEVVAYSLDPGGASVTIKVFVNSPYDDYVTARDPILAGQRHRHVDQFGGRETAHRIARLHSRGRRGISAGERGDLDGGSGRADTSFRLFTDRERAMREPDCVGANVRHVLQRLAARTVGWCAG